MAAKKSAAAKKKAALAKVQKDFKKNAKAIVKGAKGKGTIIVADAVKREKGKLYFLDKKGNVRVTSMRTGAKKGHKYCRRAK